MLSIEAHRHLGISATNLAAGAHIDNSYRHEYRPSAETRVARKGRVRRRLAARSDTSQQLSTADGVASRL